MAGAIKTFGQGDEAAPLADALAAQGVIRARLREYQSSINALRRAAAQVAEAAGALPNAGRAMLALIEEHGPSRLLPPAELYEAYQGADKLMKGTQDAEEKERLPACARVVMRRLSDAPCRGNKFTLYGTVHEFEARLIGQAPEDAGVSKAARLPGLTHQTLGSMLGTRHKQLSAKRKPPQKRFKSIIKTPKE